MALESSTYINGLVVSNPTSSDNISDGDNHIRLIKSTIKATFPNVTGAVSGSHTDINSAVTKANLATSANTATTIVKRNASGNFTAGTITAALSGNATTATRLQTARNIGGVSFNGTSSIDLPGVNTSGNQSTSGNAATATRLATARNIGGVAFNGTASINLPGVNTSGNQNTSGNAATATTATTASQLTTSRTISMSGDVTGSASFNGSQNVNITATVADDSHNHIASNIDSFAEEVQDVVGAMFSGNTETGLSATYDDADGTIDLVLTKDPTITLTGDVSGTGTMTNLGNVSITATIADDSHNHITSNIDGFTEAVQDIAGYMFSGNTETGVSATYQDGDGTVDLVLSTEYVQDIVGAMFTGNTETGLSATYQDNDGTIDLVLTKDPTITLTGDVSGTGTMTNLGNVSITATVADDSHNHVASNIDSFAEEVQDVVGAMFSGNTETGLSATYDDADGTIDLVLTKDPSITLTGDVSGTGTMTNLGNVSITATVANDSHTHDTRYFTETQADNRFLAIGGTAADSAKVDGKSVAVVSSLPGSPDANTIYFVTS